MSKSRTLPLTIKGKVSRGSGCCCGRCFGGDALPPIQNRADPEDR